MRSAQRHAIQPSSGSRKEDALPVAGRLTTRPPGSSPRHLQAATRSGFPCSDSRPSMSATNAVSSDWRCAASETRLKTSKGDRVDVKRQEIRQAMTLVTGCGRISYRNSTSRHHRAKSKNDGFGTGEALRLLTCGVHAPAGVQQDRRCSDQGADHALQMLQTLLEKLRCSRVGRGPRTAGGGQSRMPSADGRAEMP